MRNGIFEIRPTLDVQIRHKEYLDAECFSGNAVRIRMNFSIFRSGVLLRKKLAGIPLLFSPRFVC